MGWGIGFALDSQGRVYCSDGCKWRASKADYEGYPEWPSARQSVLDYFEYEAHRELDMIRDECPGTAAALKEACSEHMGEAMHRYNRLSRKEQTDLHNEMMEKLKNQVDGLEELKKEAYQDYIDARKEFKAYKPPTKQTKTRLEELENIIRPLKLELAMEEAAVNYDTMKYNIKQAKRELKLEKLFDV
jgi:polyhydroxyalkanoate synthesis regulator phasin